MRKPSSSVQLGHSGCYAMHGTTPRYSAPLFMVLIYGMVLGDLDEASRTIKRAGGIEMGVAAMQTWVDNPEVQHQVRRRHCKLKHKKLHSSYNFVPPVARATPRNPTRETAISVHFVPGMRFLVFDFGVYSGCAGASVPAKTGLLRGYQACGMLRVCRYEAIAEVADAGAQTLVNSAPLRNHMQESTLPVQFVPGMRFLVFDFGAYGLRARCANSATGLCADSAIAYVRSLVLTCSWYCCCVLLPVGVERRPCSTRGDA
eukprot:3435600-Rhodomonas_salina.15